MNTLEEAQDLLNAAFEEWWDKENMGHDTSWRRCWNAALEHAAKICESAASEYKGRFCEDDSLFIAAEECAETIRKEISK